MDACTYASFQCASMFNWTCPKCIADVMPFHDCSVLSSSLFNDTSSDVSQYESIILLKMTSLGLRVAHLNCHSLLSVAEEVFDLFTHQSIDVFAITETWLDSPIADSEIFPYTPSINIIRNDRNRHGGGVAFLLSSKVKYVVRSDLCDGNMESLWIELFPKTKRSMLFCCVYRPPSQHSFFDNFLAECETAHLQCPRFTVLGDVNADLLKPSCP